MQKYKYLSELKVSLGVEVGSVQLTAEDLVFLESGHVLQLTLEQEQEVHLKIGEEIIASGRVVKDSEGFSVRITKIFSEKNVSGVGENFILADYPAGGSLVGEEIFAAEGPEYEL